MSASQTWGEPRRSTHHLWVIPAVLLAVVVGLVVFWTVAVVTGLVAYAAFAHPAWFFFPFGFLIFLLFVFLLVRLAWWGAGGWWWGRRAWYYHSALDAREIVRARYARGEITREQYTVMLRDLGEPDPSLPR